MRHEGKLRLRQQSQRRLKRWKRKWPTRDALLWAVSLGEHRVKKSLTATSVPERHAVISQVKQEQPQMSIRHLCETLEVNRRWYYARLAQGEMANGDVE